MASENIGISPVKGFGYGNTMASVRFVPRVSTTGVCVLSENWGVSSVTRTGTAGTYTVQLSDKFPGFTWHVDYTSADITAAHTWRVESYSVSAGTLTVVHRANAGGALPGAPSDPSPAGEVTLFIYARGQ